MDITIGGNYPVLQWTFTNICNPDDFNVAGCTVKARSVSSNLGYWDEEANYCNMWNVFNTVYGFDKATVSVSECKW